MGNKENTKSIVIMYSHPSKQGTYYSKPRSMDGFPPKWKGGQPTYMTEVRHGAMTSGGSRSFLHPDFDAAASLERNYYVKLMANHCLGLVVRSCPGEERWWNKKWVWLISHVKKKSSMVLQCISHNSNKHIKGLKWQKREKWLKTADIVATCSGNYPCDC